MCTIVTQGSGSGHTDRQSNRGATSAERATIGDLSLNDATSPAPALIILALATTHRCGGAIDLW